MTDSILGKRPAEASDTQPTADIGAVQKEKQTEEKKGRIEDQIDFFPLAAQGPSLSSGTGILVPAVAPSPAVEEKTPSAQKITATAAAEVHIDPDVENSLFDHYLNELIPGLSPDDPLWWEKDLRDRELNDLYRHFEAYPHSVARMVLLITDRADRMIKEIETDPELTHLVDYGVGIADPATIELMGRAALQTFDVQPLIDLGLRIRPIAMWTKWMRKYIKQKSKAPDSHWRTRIETTYDTLNGHACSTLAWNTVVQAIQRDERSFYYYQPFDVHEDIEALLGACGYKPPRFWLWLGGDEPKYMFVERETRVASSAEAMLPASSTPPKDGTVATAAVRVEHRTD